MLLLADRILMTRIEDIEGDETPTGRKLLSVGEKILGERGFEGVALHKIAEAAGQSNKYAVQYYFQNMDGLIDAIVAIRLRWVERRRQQLLAVAGEKGLLGDLRALLEAVILPMSEQVDDQDRHSYARFRLQHKSRLLKDQSDFLVPRPGPTEENFLHIARLAGVSLTEVSWRLRLLDAVILSALVDRDNKKAAGRPVPPLAETISGTIAVMVAAFHADAWPPN
jgi:AcrR family transcriptional regulator